MSNLQTTPFHFNGNDLNVLQINEEPWFIAKDVTQILGYKSASDALRSLDEDEKLLRTICVSGQNRAVNIINESGLYSLILTSRKTEAKEFKRWVTHEVLPAIRKHGGYLTPEKTEELIANPDLIIQLASSLKSERQKVSKLTNEISNRNDIIEFQEQQIKLQTPAVEYYREVLNATDTVSTTIIAKELGMSAAKLNQILNKDYKMIYKQGDTWVPYSRFQSLNMTRTKTYTYTGADGTTKTSIQLVWTQEGRRFIHGLFKLRK